MRHRNRLHPIDYTMAVLNALPWCVVAVGAVYLLLRACGLEELP